MKFEICTTLMCSPFTTIDLPIKAWEEIKEWYIKGDTLHYTLDEDQWNKVALDSNAANAVEWKRPLAVRVYDPGTNDLIAED